MILCYIGMLTCVTRDLSLDSIVSFQFLRVQGKIYGPLVFMDLKRIRLNIVERCYRTEPFAISRGEPITFQSRRGPYVALIRAHLD